MKITIRRDVIHVIEFELDSDDWGKEDFSEIDIETELEDGEHYMSYPIDVTYGKVSINTSTDPSHPDFSEVSRILTDGPPYKKVRVYDESLGHTEFQDINTAIRESAVPVQPPVSQTLPQP